MVCAACGTTNEAGRRFCVECGARLAAGCPSCGAANPVGAKFCGDCGTALTEGSVPDPGQLVPSPAGPERAGTAERRIVSVLFVDLVGFTAASERRDHEDTRDLQDRYFETARRIVERYGGTVEKYIGDAVMAVWGAPTAHEDDAERAVRAALDLVEAVGDLATGDDPPLQARAAVLTGEAAVSVGATGQGLVTGDLVNTAARLQSVAEPGDVLVGEATQRAAGAAIAFQSGRRPPAQGQGAPVAAWRAVRVVARPGGAGRDTTLEAPFVGRERELRLLKELYEATAADRRIQLVSIVGHAGIGKSRLAWELEKSVTGLAEPAIWLQGRSPAYGDGVTLWALGEMFRQAAGIAESDDIATTDRRLAEAQGRLELSDDERAWVGLLLGHDAGTGAERDELMAGWRQAFERMSRIAPLVLVFEDLQWADDGLVDFIEELHDRSRDSRILIVTLSRPELRERRPDWGAGRRNFVSIDLEPLSDDAMTALMEGLVPGLPRPAVNAIVERAAGVPLYAVETVRMLVGQGRLVAKDGRFTVSGRLDRLEVPETLHGLIAARLDALPDRDRALVGDASVLGLAVQIDALSALAGEAAEDLVERLRSLVDHEILRLESDPASPERGQYRFLQAPVREVAYATLSKRDRRAKHLAAAAFYATHASDETAVVRATHELEALRATPSGPEADALAVQARASLRAAAERAAALWSNAQAADLYESAIAITTDPAELAWSRLRSGELAVLAARYDQADVRLREAIEDGHRLGDRTVVGRATVSLGHGFVRRSMIAEAIATLRPVVDASPDLSGDELAAECAAELATAYLLLPDLPSAEPLLDPAFAAAQRFDRRDLMVSLLISRAWVAEDVGLRPWESHAILRGALVLAQAWDLPTRALEIRTNLMAWMGQVDPQASLAIGRPGLDELARLGVDAGYFLGNVIDAATFTGDWDLVLEITDRFERADETPKARLGRLFGRWQIAAARGDIETVRPLLAEFEEPFLGSTSGQDTLAFILTRALAELLAGELAEAQRVMTSVGPMPPEFMWWWTGIEMHVSLGLNDLAAARAALALQEERRVHGPRIDANLDLLRAGIAALEGRPESSLELFDSAIGAFRSLRSTLDLAFALMHRAVLTDGLDGASEAADEARLDPWCARRDGDRGRVRGASDCAPRRPARDRGRDPTRRLTGQPSGSVSRSPSITSRSSASATSASAARDRSRQTRASTGSPATACARASAS